jgi:hypothetical protein
MELAFLRALNQGVTMIKIQLLSISSQNIIQAMILFQLDNLLFFIRTPIFQLSLNVLNFLPI